MPCLFPGCKLHAESNKYCVRHAMYSYAPGEKIVKPKMKKVGETRKEEKKEYDKIKKEMLAISDRCELKGPTCTGKAQGLHHQKKRAGNYLNRKYLKRACNNCNTWAELNPLEAISKGMSISKFKKEKVGK